MLNLGGRSRGPFYRTPFRRGTESLIRKLQEDNRRRRHVSEDEERRLLEVAPPFLRSMISITALDTGMRQGEMLALRRRHRLEGAAHLCSGAAQDRAKVASKCPAEPHFRSLKRAACDLSANSNETTTAHGL